MHKLRILEVSGTQLGPTGLNQPWWQNSHFDAAETAAGFGVAFDERAAAVAVAGVTGTFVG